MAKIKGWMKSSYNTWIGDDGELVVIERNFSNGYFIVNSTKNGRIIMADTKVGAKSHAMKYMRTHRG